MGEEPVLPSVLIDECMPRSFGEFFTSIGWTVYGVGELLPSGSPDASVVAAALDVGAIVVTTDSDYRELKKLAIGHVGRLEASDRIWFKKCSHVKARYRLEELIDVVQREYLLAKAVNRRFTIHITPESFTVFR